jgi:hypothetical protein
MKVSFLMACIIAAGLIRSASSTAATPSFDYSGYAVVLKTYVNSEGMVHYKALKGERQELDSFITSLGRLEASQFNGWSEKEKIAFWINAYNAITLQSIINNYPIKKTFPASLQFPLGIRHIAEVWKEKTHLVMNKKISLDDIEHEKLRKQFNEPRIHMALVCAAIGCPHLQNEPYEADKLEEQFKAQTVHFLSSPNNFSVDLNRKKILLSPLFDWYGKDFIKTYKPKTGFVGIDDKLRAVLNLLVNMLNLQMCR